MPLGGVRSGAGGSAACLGRPGERWQSAKFGAVAALRCKLGIGTGGTIGFPRTGVAVTLGIRKPLAGRRGDACDDGSAQDFR